MEKYRWLFRGIRFNGLPSPPPSVKNPIVLEFDSKKDFDEWYKDRTIALAEFDESMNYCEYFIREKGNQGNYVREGKSFPVDGSWVGIQDFDSNYTPTRPFVRFLEENGWRKDWFKLKSKYAPTKEENL